MKKMTREAFITQRAEDNIGWLEKRRDPNTDEIKAGILQIRDMLLAKMPSNKIHQLLASANYQVTNFLTGILNLHNRASIWIEWKADHPFLDAFIDKDYLNSSYYWSILTAIKNKMTFSDLDSAKEFIDLCLQKGFTHRDIITSSFINSNNPFHYFDFENMEKGKSAERIESAFGPYLLSLMKNPSFKNHRGEFKYNEDLIESVKSDGINLLNFILKTKVDFPLDKLQMLLYRTDYNQRKTINQQAIAALLKSDGASYEDLVLNLMDTTHFQTSDVFLAYKLLNEKIPNKYTQKLLELTKELIGDAAYDARTSYGKYTSEGTVSEVVGAFLHEYNPKACEQILLKFTKEKSDIPINFFKWIDDLYKEEAVPYIINGLKHDFKSYQQWTRNQMFDLLKKYELSSYKEDLLDLATNHSNKQGRKLITKIIADKVKPIIPEASELLVGKTIDLRITGALILSHIEDENVQNLLLETLDNEKNDDTRDVMLETLADVKYGRALNLTEVKAMIELANKRKKLKTFKEKWIEEAQLPKLYWAEDGNELSQEAVRFIFYRMRRAKGINSDLEAKQVFNAIDKEKSGPFAKALIKAFIESNANTKFKHFLSISAFLGNDEVMKDLDSLFKSSIRDKRTKMAEYVVGSLAMIGSDKALRIVEVISRKFANKKRTIAEAALNALQSAAEELDITTDELADRIIPDFGFEGLYKRFDVKGEEYRAFINSDFKLNYFNEDGKMRKSIPKDTDAEIKKELRAIEKEVRTIVKSQSGRLEKYMVEGRQWPVGDWRTFFFENPIMFVYAMKLLWVVIDENDKVLDCFYIDEDAGMYNFEDDEIELEENQKISILHPFYLDEKVQEQWKDKVYEMSLEFIFPILNRLTFKKQEEELELSYSTRFSDKVVQKGPDFTKSFLEKKGWSKQTGDGGHLEFTKIDYKTQTRAYVWIEGIYAWYQQNEGTPPVGAIDFYDLKEKKKKFVKDVNEIFYSEVMADVDALVNAK